jgi:hypothetical protein
MIPELTDPNVLALLAGHHQALLRQWDATMTYRRAAAAPDRRLADTHLRVAAQCVATLEAQLLGSRRVQASRAA